MGQRCNVPGPPYLDLTGPIEELDYTGSLATGFKSPPKQQIRFDPDEYDVDANLVAPPLAKYAIAIDHLPPKHQRIIGRNTSIEPLKQFADQAHQQLSARAKGYDPSNDDPFDVHIVDVPDLPEQERVRAATNRLYELRASLAPATYSRMVDELKTGGCLVPALRSRRPVRSAVRGNESHHGPLQRQLTLRRNVSEAKMVQDPRLQFNRLLDYRPVDDLVQMNDGDRRGLLAEVLAQPASKPAWQALWELFTSWPDGGARAEAIATAQRALAAWPDQSRMVSSADGRLFEWPDTGRRLTPIAQLVRSIELYHSDQSGSNELRAIVTSEHARFITALSIVRSEIDSNAWLALAASSHLSGLRQLRVTRTVILQPCVSALFESGTLAELQSLQLVEVGLGLKNLIATQHGVRLARLHELDLSSDALGNDGVIALAQAPWLQQIRSLTLQRNFIQADAIRALLSSANTKHLERIDMSGNKVNDLERSSLTTLAASKKIELIV